jgi:hypothetical protein
VVKLSGPEREEDRVKYLFNSRGKHIASLVNGQLHAPTGKNIGHYLEQEKIFIDMRGRYLGELVYEDRLLRNRSSPYLAVSFGSHGNYGNAGNYGNPGNHGSIGTVGGFEDVPEDLLA